MLLQEEVITISDEQARTFDSHHSQSSAKLVKALSSGASRVMVLAKADAVQGLQEFIPQMVDADSDDVVYASRNAEDAKNDIKFFFPQV